MTSVPRDDFSPGRTTSGPGGSEEGSAVVDFVLVSVLVCAIGLGLLQLGLALHVRNTLTWAAGEGARVGARSGAVPEDGARRARELIRSSLAPQYASAVTAHHRRDGAVDIVEVQVVAPLPLLALWGPAESVTTRGRAFVEEQP